MTVSEKIYTLRTRLGLSQEELAEKLGVSRQSVSKWETGQSVPDLEKIIKLSDLFGVSVDELVREGERPKPPQPQIKGSLYQGEVEADRDPDGRFLYGTDGIGPGPAGAGGEKQGSWSSLVRLWWCWDYPLLLAKKASVDHLWMAGAGHELSGLESVHLHHALGNSGGEIQRIAVYLKYGERYISYLIVGVAAVVRGLLTLALIFLTWRAWRKERQEKELP